MLPKDFIGIKYVLGDGESLTSMVGNEDASTVSVIADSSVELYLILKGDLFRNTSYALRQSLREKVDKLHEGGHTGKIHHQHSLGDHVDWHNYRKDLVHHFVVKRD